MESTNTPEVCSVDEQMSIVRRMVNGYKAQGLAWNVDPDDVFQEAMVELLTEGSKRSMSRDYAATVARNAIKRYMKKQKRMRDREVYVGSLSDLADMEMRRAR